MDTAATRPRHNRTITVDFHAETTYGQLLDNGKAFVDWGLACIFALGFQLRHQATCRGGGCLTRHSPDVRVRLGGLPLWRLQCTTGQAVCTVLPPLVWRSRQMRPEVAREAWLATHGGLRWERWAGSCHLSAMAIYRLICAFGHQSLVAVLSPCGLALPVYCLADEQHSHGLRDQVSPLGEGTCRALRRACWRTTAG
jgi:hypothetical protein